MSLSKIPYIHRIYMDLANPIHTGGRLDIIDLGTHLGYDFVNSPMAVCRDASESASILTSFVSTPMLVAQARMTKLQEYGGN
jgi:hypothetical protein